MRKFIYEILVFCTLVGSILFLGLFLPNTQIRNSLDFALIDKHKRLKEIPSPKIILAGGSNLSFGINSSLIKDSTGIDVINTGIHASYGLKFHMDDILCFINQGDIVVLSPEYHQFFGNLALGEEALLKILFDVDPGEYKNISFTHWLFLSKYIPRYSARKILNDAVFLCVPGLSRINITEDYLRTSFNKYGDVTTHWGKGNVPFPTDNEIKGKFNRLIVKQIFEFKRQVGQKGAFFCFLFPTYQESSFRVNVEKIQQVKKNICNKDIIILGSAEEYMLPDSLFYNTAYHPTKEGLDLRTRLLIDKLKDANLIRK